MKDRANFANCMHQQDVTANGKSEESRMRERAAALGAAAREAEAASAAAETINRDIAEHLLTSIPPEGPLGAS